jgi:hypothetical protein
VVGDTPWSRFVLGERTPGSHCTGDLVGLRAGLDKEATENIFVSSGDRIVVIQIGEM